MNIHTPGQGKAVTQENPWRQSEADLILLGSAIDNSYRFTKEAALLLTAAGITEPSSEGKQRIGYLRGEILYAFRGICSEIIAETRLHVSELRSLSHADLSFDLTLEMVNSRCERALHRLGAVGEMIEGAQDTEPGGERVPLSEVRITTELSGLDTISAMGMVHGVIPRWRDVCSRVSTDETLRTLLPVASCWKRSLFVLFDAVGSSLTSVAKGLEYEGQLPMAQFLAGLGGRYSEIGAQFKISGAYAREGFLDEDAIDWEDIKASIKALPPLSRDMHFLPELEEITKFSASKVAILNLALSHEEAFKSNLGGELPLIKERHLQRALECRIALLRLAKKGQFDPEGALSDFDPETLMRGVPQIHPRTAFLATQMMDEVSNLIERLSDSSDSKASREGERVNKAWSRVIPAFEGALGVGGAAGVPDFLQKLLEVSLSAAQTNFMKAEAARINAESAAASTEEKLECARTVVKLMQAILERGAVQRDRLACAEILHVATPAIKLLEQIGGRVSKYLK